MLLFFDGFEDCDVQAKPEWNYQGAARRVGGVRPGGMGAKSANYVDNGNYVKLPAAVTKVYVGSAFFTTTQFYTKVIGNNSVFIFQLRTDAGVEQISITIHADGLYRLRTGSSTGTIVAAATNPVMADDQWYHLQMYAEITTAATGRVILRHNGQVVLDYTGVTAVNADPVKRMGVSGAGDYAGAPYYDDMWICDTVDGTSTQGRPNNTFLGNLKVISAAPNAPGDTTQLTPTASPNWSTVDENPASAADYNGSSDPAKRDLYQITDTPASTSKIYAIRTQMVAQKSDAGLGAMKLLVKTPTAEVVDATLDLSTTPQVIYGSIRPTRPSGVPWEPADINALQVGAETV